MTKNITINLIPKSLSSNRYVDTLIETWFSIGIISKCQNIMRHPANLNYQSLILAYRSCA